MVIKLVLVPGSWFHVRLRPYDAVVINVVLVPGSWFHVHIRPYDPVVIKVVLVPGSWFHVHIRPYDPVVIKVVLVPGGWFHVRIRPYDPVVIKVVLVPGSWFHVRIRPYDPVVIKVVLVPGSWFHVRIRPYDPVVIKVVLELSGHATLGGYLLSGDSWVLVSVRGTRTRHTTTGLGQSFYLIVLLFGVGWNEVFRPPPSGELVVLVHMIWCGVYGGRGSRTHNSVEVLLWRALSRI